MLSRRAGSFPKMRTAMVASRFLVAVDQCPSICRTERRDVNYYPREFPIVL